MSRLLLVILGCLAVVRPAAAADFLLEINGTPAMQYIGNCQLVGAPSGETFVKFDGLVPDALKIAASSLSCVVQKWDARGRLEVTLSRRREMIAYGETAAAFNWVQVWSDSPAGEPGARRGAVPVPRIERNPNPSSIPQTTPVPPFSGGPIVPPLDSGRTRQR